MNSVLDIRETKEKEKEHGQDKETKWQRKQRYMNCLSVTLMDQKNTAQGMHPSQHPKPTTHDYY